MEEEKSYAVSTVTKEKGDGIMYEVIKSNEEFRRVYRSGKSFANKYLVMYVLKNDIQKNRIGITVSKKVGNSVIRHRVTRLIREAFRLNIERFKDEIGMDIVVVARQTAKGRKYQEIESAVMHLGRLHKILRDDLL